MEKYIQQSTSLFGSIKNAVLGNPVTREFTLGQQVASFGPGMLWKVYEGKKKTTGQDVSVFIFEKSLIDRFGKHDRELILERMKHGPQQLTKLRHPRILTVQHPLEESRDSLAFATEPVFASLSNVMGKHENFSGEMPSSFKDFELYSVEKVYGLLQIAEGLAFLHNDANLNEGNLTTDNVIITKGGQWKLAGFHFSRSKVDMAAISQYSTKSAPVTRQELNYLAPEWILSQAGEYSFDLAKSDMFSFGCLISAVYNHLKTPFDAGDSIASYKKCTEQLSRIGSDYLQNVPNQVRDHISLLLNVASETRPDARSTLSHPFFDDVAVMTLKYLDSLVQRDDVTKSQFFKNLHHVLDKLPLRVLHQKILPPLFSEFPNHMMIPFVLTNVFLIAKQSTKEQYMELIFPELKKIFHITKPIQVLLIFMQQMELMLQMTDQDNIKNFVLPLIFRALEANSEQIQELVLTIIPNFIHMIDYSSIKNSIVPRLKVLIMKVKSEKVRVNALVCIGKIIDNLDKFILIDEIFPALTQIPSREPAVLMGILAIYKQTISHKKMNLEKDYLATKAVPFLLPLAVEPSLNVKQFNNFMSVIRDMVDRVEQEHRTKLEQLQKMQDEQRSSIDFVKAANQSTDSSDMDNVMSKIDRLVVGDSSKVSANTKAIESNSEFAKVFGLSDKSPSSSSSSSSLMGSSSVSSVKTKSDMTPFDPVRTNLNSTQSTITTQTKTPSNRPQVTGGMSSLASNRMMNANLTQMSFSGFSAQQGSINANNTSNLSSMCQAKPSLSSLDAVLTPEMNNFKSMQQSVPLNAMQQQHQHAGHSSQQPFQSNISNYGQSHPSMGYNSKPPTMQSQTQSVSMYQPQTQMFIPGMNNISGMSGQGSMNFQASTNMGVLQPRQSNVLQPSTVERSNLSKKDLDDLLL